MEDVLGWILIVLGILFLIVGLIEAFRKVTGGAPQREAGGIDWPKLIEALVKAGLLYIAVGIVLLILGLELTGQDVLTDEEGSQSLRSSLRTF